MSQTACLFAKNLEFLDVATKPGDFTHSALVKSNIWYSLLHYLPFDKNSRNTAHLSLSLSYNVTVVDLLIDCKADAR